MATNLSESDVKAIMDGFAKKVLANLSKPPKYDVKIDVHDEGDEPRWIGVDVDFTYADHSAQASRDTERAREAFAALVDKDERMEVMEEGGGDGFIGLSLDIGRDDSFESDDSDDDAEQVSSKSAKPPSDGLEHIHVGDDPASVTVPTQAVVFVIERKGKKPTGRIMSVREFPNGTASVAWAKAEEARLSKGIGVAGTVHVRPDTPRYEIERAVAAVVKSATR